MKTTALILLSALFLCVGCKTQQNSEKAIQQRLENQLAYEKAVTALDSLDFVLEADRITFKNGQSTYVNANTNFISAKGDKATVQLAFNSAFYSGPNGIGGITLDGRISNVKKSIDKKGNVTFSMSVFGTGISAEVSFTMYNGNNQCSATVNSNFSSRNITFSGYLYPSEESSVFKGRSL
ncbi:DUF4251 domain-containing protein [Dysgonomonas macrotermitis]|uniref:DUF4251 domain-containing protein n=1 Tax=Dysgonomonas macrotermitis TaxID=1346286 RepID=A0A1M5H281_9BACT|nr:DUF4251 domain-containing protein [Dysgonomonas macrotermitis]SHG10109.1 protein of unknown function [Dysgonomonas macrotermitis]